MKRFLTLVALVPALVLADDLKPERTISVTSAASTAVRLTSGRKLINCTQAAYYVMGNASTVAAATSDVPLATQQLWEIDVTADNQWISFIRQTADGTCYVRPVIRRET